MEKVKLSKELENKVYDLIELAKNSGKIRKGTNEATKAIERGITKFVAIAEDVTPPEIIMHLPKLCNDRKIPFCYVGSKKELGSSAGLEVPTAAVAITELSEGKDILMELKKAIEKLKKE